jgi:hypothetical protein
MPRLVGRRDKGAERAAVEPEYRSGLDRAEAKLDAGRTPRRIEINLGRDVATCDYSSLAYGLCAGPDIGPRDRNVVGLAEGP